MNDNRVALVLPQLGNASDQVMINEWLVEVGETVQEGEPVLTFESDKASSELPAPTNGRLVEVLVEDEDEVEVGTVVGWLEPVAQ